jgi:hypothetical protein
MASRDGSLCVERVSVKTAFGLYIVKIVNTN